MKGYKYFRKEIGYQQKEFADLLHIDQSTLSRIESGNQIPSIRLKIAMSKYLMQPIEFLEKDF